MTRKYHQSDSPLAYLRHRKIVAHDGPAIAAAERFTREWQRATLPAAPVLEAVEERIDRQRAMQRTLASMGCLAKLVVGYLVEHQAMPALAALPPAGRIGELARMVAGRDTPRHRAAVRILLRLSLIALAEHYGVQKNEFRSHVKLGASAKMNPTTIKSENNDAPEPSHRPHGRTRRVGDSQQPA